MALAYLSRISVLNIKLSVLRCGWSNARVIPRKHLSVTIWKFNIEGQDNRGNITKGRYLWGIKNKKRSAYKIAV